MMDWKWFEFPDLTPALLHDLMAMRQEIFVVEQRCVYLDADGKDPRAYHLAGWQNGVLVATTRVLPPGVSYPEASLGRVAVRASARGLGLGKVMMVKALDLIAQLYPTAAVKISAQTYLQRFYEAFGFQVKGPAYLEDGILHYAMRRPSPAEVAP